MNFCVKHTLLCVEEIGKPSCARLHHEGTIKKIKCSLCLNKRGHSWSPELYTHLPQQILLSV